MVKQVREVVVEGDIAYIQLTKGYKAIIDASIAHVVGQYNWYALVVGKLVYAVRKSPRPASKTILMHREILKPDVGQEVDHRNGNGLDNRLSNLRCATSQQNKHNQRAKGNNKSGYKGVFWETRSKRWLARIMIDGKTKYLGSFTNPEDAHKAYCVASKLFHGEFGRVA